MQASDGWRPFFRVGAGWRPEPLRQRRVEKNKSGVCPISCSRSNGMKTLHHNDHYLKEKGHPLRRVVGGSGGMLNIYLCDLWPFRVPSVAASRVSLRCPPSPRSAPQVALSTGVPTVWRGVRNYIEPHGPRKGRTWAGPSHSWAPTDMDQIEGLQSPTWTESMPQPTVQVRFGLPSSEVRQTFSGDCPNYQTGGTDPDTTNQTAIYVVLGGSMYIFQSH